MTAAEEAKAKAKKRTEMLAGLREQHGDTVAEVQAQLKEQKLVRRELLKALKSGPQTVPQLADETGLPAHEVLWHVAAMKKYGEVVEAGLDEDYEYYLYGLARED